MEIKTPVQDTRNNVQWSVEETGISNNGPEEPEDYNCCLETNIFMCSSPKIMVSQETQTDSLPPPSDHQLELSQNAKTPDEENVKRLEEKNSGIKMGAAKKRRRKKKKSLSKDQGQIMSSIPDLTVQCKARAARLLFNMASMPRVDTVFQWLTVMIILFSQVCQITCDVTLEPQWRVLKFHGSNTLRNQSLHIQKDMNTFCIFRTTTTPPQSKECPNSSTAFLINQTFLAFVIPTTIEPGNWALGYVKIARDDTIGATHGEIFSNKSAALKSLGYIDADTKPSEETNQDPLPKWAEILAVFAATFLGAVILVLLPCVGIFYCVRSRNKKKSQENSAAVLLELNRLDSGDSDSSRNQDEVPSETQPLQESNVSTIEENLDEDAHWASSNGHTHSVIVHVKCISEEETTDTTGSPEKTSTSSAIASVNNYKVWNQPKNGTPTMQLMEGNAIDMASALGTA